MNKSEHAIKRQETVHESQIYDEGHGIRRTGPLKILLESERVTSSDLKTSKKARNVKADYFQELKRSEKPNKKLLLQEKASTGGTGVRHGSPIPAFDRNKSYIEAITSEKVRRNSGQQKENSKIASPHLQHPQDEIKLTKSDYRKIHINEILKGHAQKVDLNSSNSCVQAKEKPLQGVAELLLKVKNVDKKDPETGNPQKWREPPPEQKNDYDTKVDDNSSSLNGPGKQKTDPEDPSKKTPNLFLNDILEAKKNPLQLTDDVHDKVTKVIAHKCVEYQKSKDLETRLHGSWNENSFFHDAPKNNQKDEHFPVDNLTGDPFLLQEGTAIPQKLERKPPYTDRLALIRHPGRTEKKEPNNQIMKGKKIDDTKMTAEGINKSFSPLLSTISGNEPIKPRATRSAELRDLVNQAVREHKIFCIFDNHWYIVRPVREELLNRGWLEVIPDRRLIPRRRPPPTGPVLEREKTVPERNCNTIEAILAAKEIFVNELEETVSRSPNLKLSPEKPGLSLSPLHTIKKSSDLSLKESDSSFRIIPPTSDKKKNNFEIREFIHKCHPAPTGKPTEKDNQNPPNKPLDRKSKKSKEPASNTPKNRKSKLEGNQQVTEPTPLNRTLQTILDTVNDHKKTIHKALTEGRQPAEESEPPIELTPTTTFTHQDNESGDKAQSSSDNLKVVFKEAEAKAISKIIQATNAKIHFMWLSIKPSIHLKCFNYSPEIINKFQKTSFCTKIGLWNHLNNIQWYAHEVHFPAKFPRMYNTGEADDLQAFFQDFQITACIGMLKWLADTFFDRGIKAVQTKKGKVPLRAFEFAIKQCEKYIRFKDNEDLSTVEEPRALQEEWNTFLQWFYTITNDNGKLQESSSAQLMVVYTKAVETLRVMKKHWPEMDIDGRLNIWIMKPYCASCGRGIFMTNNVYYIGQHSKYIVQKYIEKPLLIYNTKFDIRQWFMITKLTPLEIWMYKECYLRFCTQPFALRNLHESVHLSNNSVQRKYVNRYDNTLSDQNMWDSNTFQMYLNTIGHPNAWNEVIYPGMRDAIVSVMLSAQDTFDGPRRSWFEVYGADFMLSANVKDGPWLIEINENPAMDPSTKVTAKLCPQMLRDVIKVVVDKRTNKNASTGQWELVYRQNYSPSFATVDLDVKGRRIARAPTSMKIEFSQTPTTAYEVVKGLTEAGEVPQTAHSSKPPPDPKKLDPLYILKKEHEKFRQKCPIENAKDMIDRILMDDNGKNIKRFKNTSDSDFNTSHSPIQKKFTPTPNLSLQNYIPNPTRTDKSSFRKPSDNKNTSKGDGKQQDDIFNLSRFY